MKIFMYILLATLLDANINEVNAQEPRRIGDELYPPPMFIKAFQIIHDVCVEKTGTTEEEIGAFSNGGVDVPASAALRCYMNCLFHEVNIVDDDGEMHYEKLKRIIPESLKDFITVLVEGCESHIPQGATQCDRAWSWNLCWKEMDPKHYFLP